MWRSSEIKLIIFLGPRTRDKSLSNMIMNIFNISLKISSGSDFPKAKNTGHFKQSRKSKKLKGREGPRPEKREEVFNLRNWNSFRCGNQIGSNSCTLPRPLTAIVAAIPGTPAEAQTCVYPERITDRWCVRRWNTRNTKQMH